MAQVREFARAACACGAGHESRRNIMGLMGAGGLAALASRSPVAMARPVPPDYFGAYRELPVGAVRPKGWIEAWLRRQGDGLTGHPEAMEYPYNTCLFAGAIPWRPEKHGEIWWPYEQAGYFIDGATRLAALVDAPRSKALSRASLAYIMQNAGPGKLGASTWAWPNAVVGRALMACEDNFGAVRALRASLGPETSTSGRDGFVAEQALYVYGKTGDRRLLDQARRIYSGYFLDDPASFSSAAKIRGAAPLRAHGVTAAEQLKLAPLYYLHSGDPQALELACTGFAKAVRENMMPDGGMVSSESLGAPAFNSMHETCDLTDWSWAMGYMLMASGEGGWGDAIETTTFNALPGAVTKDFRQVQYFSSPNQLLASNTACPRIAPTRMSYRPAHDTPCCPGNVSRAMPNYVTRMWMMTKAGDGLAATLYGPCEVRTRLGGRTVAITETTDYPFRDTIRFDVKLRGAAAFALHLRIPKWCEGARVRVNGADAGIDCRPGAFAEVRRLFRDGDRIDLILPMRVTSRTWYAGAAASVERGPLVYALKIAETSVTWSKDPPSVRAILHDRDLNGIPAIEFFPNGEWRYGWEAATLADASAFRVTEFPVGDNPFLPGAEPVRIEAPVRPLPDWQPDWQPDWRPASNSPVIDFKTAPKTVADLPTVGERRRGGPVVTATFVPLGATHLRLTTLPLLA